MSLGIFLSWEEAGRSFLKIVPVDAEVVVVGSWFIFYQISRSDYNDVMLSIYNHRAHIRNVMVRKEPL